MTPDTVSTKAGAFVVAGGVPDCAAGEGLLVVVALVVLVVLVTAVALVRATARCRAADEPEEQPARMSPGPANAATAATDAIAGTRPGTGSQPSGARRRARSVPAPTVLALAALALAGCAQAAAAGRGQGDHRAHDAGAPGPTTTSTTSTTTTTTSTTVPAPPPPTTSRSAVSPTTAPPAVDIAGQRVVVSAGAYGSTVATLTAYQRTTSGWRVAFGPWTANIGYTGFAAPGQKHEGDGHTPSGTYAFGFAFGVQADPGVRLPWRPVTGPNIVWDDDPSSPIYNQWVDTDTANAGASPEPMDNSPAYDYGAVIDYNMAPVVPGAGSAIFFHVSTGGSTAGCVSLPRSELLDVLRWLDPAQQPSIAMGVGVGGP